MERFQKIFAHPLFQQYMQANAEKEKSRVFCRHNISHVTDVARIMYLLNGEIQAGLSKDMVYGAALLHDIGRHVQYETGEKHGQAGARMAPEILRACGYTEPEIELICEAIRRHSDKTQIGGKDLSALLAQADQLSRACYACPARERCDWPKERKNKMLIW